MSETLQTGAGMGMEHPDAEQLTAFAEQAMPAWEREQVLGHLAGCAACRQVVFVAQAGMPEVEEVAAVPERPRRRWFGGWGLAWAGAAGALAGAVVLTVQLVRRADDSKIGGQTAKVQEIAPPVAGPTLEKRAEAPAPERDKVRAVSPQVVMAPQKATAPAAADAISAERAAPPKLPAALPAMNTEASGRGAVHGVANGVRLGTAAPAGAATAASPAAGVPSAATVRLGAAAPTAVVTAPKPVVVSQGQLQTLDQATAAGQAAAPLRSQTTQGYAMQGGLVQSGAGQGRAGMQGQTGRVGEGVAAQQYQALPPPAARAPAPQTTQRDRAAQVPMLQNGLSETVQVSAAASSLDTTAVVSADATPEAVFSLPSHLPSVSAIERQSQVLAIDSKGAVFLSRDKGQHWTAVAQAWSGRPVQVGFVDGGATSANDSLRGSLATAAKPGLPAGEGFEVMHGAVAGQAAELTGVVSDQTGAVIPNANVRLTRSDGSGGATARTDASGRWAVEGVAAGRYRAQVDAPGFIAEARELQLKAGDRAMWRVRLPVGAATESVTVNGAMADVATKRVRTPAAVFELRTDTGVVWTSVDGVSWRRSSAAAK